MHSPPLELSRKRVELNVCESFKYFTYELLRKYLKKKIFVILKGRFHHEGVLSESRYFELFFSTRYRAPSDKKSAFTEPPFLLFLMFGLISSNSLFSKYLMQLFGQNIWVITLSKQLHLDKYAFFRWEIRPYSWTFFDLKKRPNAHLNL